HGRRGFCPLRWELPGVALADALDEGLRGGELHSRRQPGDGFVLPVIDGVLGERTAQEGQPDLRAEWIVRAAGGDTHHHAIGAAPPDGPTDDRRVGAETALP